MRYALLIYTAQDSDPEECALKVKAFNQMARRAGVLEAAQPLQDVATATSVQLRDGQLLVTDGPFAETKEQLAGFLLLNCDDPIEWASQLPMLDFGSVEIRPIWEMEPPTDT